ncbi:hypothetical protein BY458DRAFT_148453 [Sporodiniella umbellata]|nr:hypothetical protein BY458DRAFT_148453 [Sporodiniella umbellata]
MPKFCRYCKAMGHTRESCSERPTENRSCFTCGVKGHLSVNCTRAPPKDADTSKRPRRVAPKSAITIRNIARPRAPSIITQGPREATPPFEDIDFRELPSTQTPRQYYRGRQQPW